MAPVQAAPATAEQVAELLAEARAAGRRLVPSGSGTKLRWLDDEAPESALLSTRGLSRTIEHYAGDLVATIPAGVTLAEANATLAKAHQWLPLDPAFADRATIGGIVATNDSGPRRHRHGAPRDMIVGIEVALTDGRVARAGGRVVKNVAGYDLSRLLCGSHGSLAVITSATFKLAPIAPASLTLVADCSSLAQAVELTQVVAASPVTPSAFEIEAPRARLLIRFETTAGAAAQMGQAAQRLLEAGGAAVSVVSDTGEAELWEAHHRLPWRDAGCLVKVSVLPTDTPRIFDALARQAGLQWTAIGRIALGVLMVRLEGEAAVLISAIAALRAAIGVGQLALLTAPATLRAEISRGPAPGAADVMRAVKQRFDPDNVLRRLPLES